VRNAFLLILIFILSGQAQAIAPDADDFALGAMIGSMGSISGKYWFTNQAAAELGVEFLDHPWSVFYADFLWHFPKLFGSGTRFGRETSAYAGGGAGMGFWDRLDTCGRWNCHWNQGSTGTGTGLFLRSIFGMEWYPGKSRFGIFAELVPSYMWYPNGSAFDGGIGGRYYF
jgi:hypothetical protein